MLEGLNNSGQQGENPNGNQGQVPPNEPSRSEQRQKDLADKLKEQEARHALELEEKEKVKMELEKKTRELEFELGLSKESGKYPHAIEYKDQIKSYAEKGLSVEEATKLVLVNNNKLVSREEIQKNNVDANSFGGSSATVVLSGEQDPSKMTQAERRAALEKLENDGRFGLKDSQIFIN